MKKILLVLAFAGLCISSVDAQNATEKKVPHSARLSNNVPARRTEIILPSVNGFNCYKGDFHIHTSFSDGNVTPGARILEAWYDGLDIVAITDHYEGQKGIKTFFKVAAGHADEGQTFSYKSASKTGKVSTDFEAIHKLAEAQIEKSGLPMLLVRGCEMARNAQSHGHFNVLFLSHFNDLYNKDMAQAFRNAKKQGAIIIHNHPAWRRKTSDKTEFHQQVYNEGLIDGVEVVNGTTFYPQIVRRCLDEKLTMYANTDEHGMTASRFGSAGFHRTMTLVFAKNLTEKAVKDALLKRRTLAYAAGTLIGEESLLKDFLNAAVDCRITKIDEKKGTRSFQVTNMSSITYRLRRGKTIYELEPFKSLRFDLGKDKKSGKYLEPKFSVENMYHVDYKHPSIQIELDK